MHFYVQSDICVVGQNPEMADMTNPRGEVFGLRWYVVAADERGNTHEMTMPNEATATTLAERLGARWSRLGRLPVDFARWTPGRAVYGSEAYVEHGQDDDLAWERRCDEDEALGLR